MTSFDAIYFFLDFSAAKVGLDSSFISFHFFSFHFLMLQESVMAVGMFVCGGMVVLGMIMGVKIVSYTHQKLELKNMTDLTEPMVVKPNAL